MTNSGLEKGFSIREANQTLPLVRMIVEDIVVLSRQVNETRDRLAYLGQGRPDDDNEYSKELQAIEDSNNRKTELLEKYLAELVSINAISDSAEEGYVDFPAIREDKPICLCWRKGEDEVMHWHGLDEDCSKRRTVDLPLIRQSGDRATSNSA